MKYIRAMSSKPGPQLHGSIPGYNPSRPLLTRGNKIFMVSLVIAPAITYGLMKLRHQQMIEEEMQLEREGRLQWESAYGKGTGATTGKEGGGTD